MKRKANALSLCLAAALLLGLSQCKKQETPITPPTPEETEEGIHITLDVEDGSRHVVIPGDNEAEVKYTLGDKIYVGDGSKYIGTLTNTGSTGGTGSHFEGIILFPSTNTSFLHFYFVGGLNPGNLTLGSTSAVVDISNQSSGLPVLSYGKAPYRADATSYTCMLENKCALVKFGLNYNTSSAVSVVGMLTKATINFENPIVPDPEDPESQIDHSIMAGNTTGSITLYSESGTSKWAILLPQSVSSATVIIGSTEEGAYNKSYNNVTVPVIKANDYITSDITIDNHPEFSVSTSTKVMFSKGNLQYQASSTTNSWRFADNQWDYVGTHPEGQTGQGTIDGSDNAKILDEGYTGWMDLFGWGTWGSNGNPLNISTESGDYTWNEFTETLDDHNDWRTLLNDEWTCLLNERHTNKINNVANARYAKAMVNNVAGLIVFSDNYSQPLEVTPPTNINVYRAPYTGNNYSADEWNILADYGAVFMPAAGNRTVTTETTTEGEPPTTITTTTINVNDAGSKGYYWTSTTDSHNYVEFDNTDIVENTATNLQFGCAVRLVRDIE